MDELKERIQKEGKVEGNEIVKVGSFLNQQIDTSLLKRMAQEVKRLFNENITKVVTIEASGIAFACAIATEYNIPFVFAKKNNSSNLSGELVCAQVYSFTHNEMNRIVIPKAYIKSTDQILIADDFLANGKSLQGLINIVEECGAKVVGCVVQIEKEFQNGGNAIRRKGYRVEALASIKEISDDIIKFN